MLEHIKAFFAKLPVRNMSKRKVLATVSALVVIVSVVTITAFAAAATYKVTVNEAGKKAYTVSTRADSVEKFVEDNADALSLGKYDYLDTSSFEVGESCTVTVLRAQVIKVIDNGEEHFLNGAGPAAQMLEKHNMALGKFDEINLADNEFVSSDKTLEIKRSFGVTVIADGKSNDVQIASGTVKDAVARAGVTLGENDETDPALDTELTNGMEINVLRVEYKERTETVKIPFDTVTKRSPDLYVDQTKVSVEGVDGEKIVTYKDKYVNGDLDSSETVNEKITKQMVTEVILKGRVKRVKNIKLKTHTPISELKVPARVQLDANGVPKNYKRIVDGTATAYYGGGGTASGRKAMPGHIAVNPKQFPYGTELYIVSLDGRFVYGYCIAADTGGFAKANTCTVDLYMNTYEECCAWGYRGVRIYVL